MDGERYISHELVRIVLAVTGVKIHPRCRIYGCAFMIEDDSGAFSGVTTDASLVLSDEGIEMIGLSAG